VDGSAKPTTDGDDADRLPVRGGAWDSKRNQEVPEMVMLREADEVRDIAREVIAAVPDHAALADVRIEYVFRDKAPRSKGRIVLGRARKITGLNAYLADKRIRALSTPSPFFVVEISEDTWQGLSPAQRRALVDHELCHCRVEVDDDGEVVLSTRGHDFEEFASIIRRHGLWSTAAETVAAAVCEQLALAVDAVTDFVGNLPLDDPKPSDADPGDAGEPE
jgi:Putative phage metallopeptidase